MALSSLLSMIGASDLLWGHGAMLCFLFILVLLVEFSVDSEGVGSIKKPEPAPHQELLRVSFLMTSSPCLLLAIAGSRVKVTISLDGSMVSLKSLLKSGYEGFNFRGRLDFPTPVDDFPFVEGRYGLRLAVFFGISTMSTGIPPVDKASGLKMSMDADSSTVGPEEPCIWSISEMVRPLWIERVRLSGLRLVVPGWSLLL